MVLPYCLLLTMITSLGLLIDFLRVHQLWKAQYYSQQIKPSLNNYGPILSAF